MKVSQWQKQHSSPQLINKVKSFKRQLEKQSIIELYSQCQICSTELKFNYKAAKNAIIEQAHCPCCNKSAPKRKFSCH